MKSIFQVVLVSHILCLLANAFKDPHFASGRTVMIHLFEWKWNDIASECERFLAPKGYAGVQVSPPNEHALVDSPYRPWYQRYQPVSYKLNSRSGNEDEFRNMVQRCNAVGVRIYVDAVINHMAAGSGVGSSGTYFSTWPKTYPNVPFYDQNFNDRKCRTSSGNIENYNDIFQVRDCKLVGLPDLDLGSDYVRDKIVNYLNTLIDIGVAGFRIDAAKHIWPGDLQAIYNRLKNVRSDVFGNNKKPFIYQEVIDLGGSEPIRNTDYTHLGRVTEFKYGLRLSSVVLKNDGNQMKYLRTFGNSWGFINSDESLVFIDNHDNQRGHGGGGQILTFFESRAYKIATAFMLAWPYGVAQIMSSYNFAKHQDWQGPPSNGGGDIKDVIVNSDDTCGNGWVCEHRWRQIYNMNGFRNAVGHEQTQNWWDNGANQIAFSRGNKGFIAINNDNFDMDYTLFTGMPAGQYCDIISGNKVDNRCTGKVITVHSNMKAHIVIHSWDETPIVAFHANSRL